MGAVENLPPLVANMLAGLDGLAATAFLRATEFAEPHDAEGFAWQVDYLIGGPVALPAIVDFACQPFPAATPIVAHEIVGFILDRAWHARFGNRKPPQWSTP